MSNSAEPLLSVRGVTVRFGGIVALDGVSFDVQRGDICGLIGPNGAGKTTLFNCLSRLYQYQAGDILFEGKSITNTPTHQIAGLGMGRTFQNLAMFRTMPVRENVMVGAHCRSSAGFLSSALRLPSVSAEEARLRDKALKIMDDLDLTQFQDRPVGDLPFGIQKRVEFARALAAEPKLLLLDEPAARPEPRGAVRAVAADPRRARPPGHHRAAGRAPHEPGDERVRPHRRAELRPQDRRRQPRAHPEASGRDRGLSGSPRQCLSSWK